jgi:DNA-binding winged helix-turn-helix (wHTH) protein/TolB-like protein
MALKLRHFYEFGPFRLEPEERLLLADNQSVPIAPKYFELLVFLVQNQGRLVTKDRIMEAIWSNSFVEEANLTVAISAIRKALGEKESSVQYIETVPKKGYRFAAPVRELEVEEAPAHSSIPDSTLSIASSPSRRLDTEGPSAHLGSPLAGPASVDQAATWERRQRDRRDVSGSPSLPAISGNARRYRMVTSTIIVLAIALLVGIVFRTKPSARKPPLTATHRLAILPLQNLQHDSGNDFLGFSLADAVITKLDYISSLTVRPSAAVERYRDEVIDIPKVAAELNVDTLLTGSFIRDGDDLRITYQLIDVKTGKMVGRDTIDVKYDNLLRVQDNVAQQIIKGLELNLSASETERIKADTPSSPLAYEYYLRGLDLFGKHDFPLAIKMLERSSEIDPSYALTWAYLGASYTSDAAFEMEGLKQYQKAQAAYERALTLQPNQLEAQMFLANLLVDTGRVEQAVPVLRDALRINPNHAAAHWELGYAYRFAGVLDESAAECERARKIDPLVKSNGSVCNTYLYLGQYDRFLRSLPDPSDSGFFLFYRGLGEYYLKNLEQASKDFDRAFALDASLYTQIGRALSDSIAHRNPDGLEILHGLENRMKERGVGDPEAMYKIGQAYAVLGDKSSALRLLRKSVDYGFFCYPYLTADPLLDELRSEPDFNVLVNAARQRHESFRRKFF